MCGPVPGMLKAIVSTPGFRASSIACRSDPGPLSFVFVTVKVAGRTTAAWHPENSDVLPTEFVAVAV